MKLKAVLLTLVCLPLLANAQINAGQRCEALKKDSWNSSMWISAANAPVIKGHVRGNTWQAADGASWFTCCVKNDKKVKYARWMTTALGVYDIYVNGKIIGCEVLKPGFTHYQKTKRSFTYDVTDAIQTKAGAENIFSAQVTPGWWADKIITPNNGNGMYGKKCAFRCVLELTFTDGSVKVYGTDLTNWKAGIAGPVTHAAIFDGEYYDARIPQGFCTPEKLTTPELNTEFNGEILPSQGAEVYFRHDLTLSPTEAYLWEGVEGASENAYGKVIIVKKYESSETMSIAPGQTLVVDFGQNTSAVPSFIFKAAEGTVLKCLPSEILNDGNGAKSRGMDGPEGSCHRLNLRTPDNGMILQYTFSDKKGFVEYTPRRTFYGYRYVSITATDDVQIKSIRSIPVSSITSSIQTGTISTGNKDINKLISNTYWGMLSNYLSVPTDCPQRNERLGWTADTQVFTETGTFFANTSSFMHKWLRDMRDSQAESGAYPGVAPYAQYGNTLMRFGWADAGIIVPWVIWKQFNDTAIIDESWDSMAKFMDHIIATDYDHEMLVAENGNYQYADWLSYEPLESSARLAFQPNPNGGKRTVPYPESIQFWNFLSQSYMLMDAEMMRDMGAATGRNVEKFEEVMARTRTLLTENYLNADGTFKTQIMNTMQTPALFALRNNLLEGQARDNMIQRLRENFREHGNCLQTGFLGTSILMPTLTENGMSDLAYELLFQRKNPSWLYSIDNGATTIWERWNSYMIEHGMGPKGMNSFNHYAYGCVCEWLWETAAGIAADPSAPGFRHIIMKPIPDKRLGHVNAEYHSVSGTIKSAWNYDGNIWTWRFTIPEGCTADVTLPGKTESKEYKAGSYTITIHE